MLQTMLYCSVLAQDSGCSVTIMSKPPSAIIVFSLNFNGKICSIGLSLSIENGAADASNTLKRDMFHFLLVPTAFCGGPNLKHQCSETQ